MKVSETLDCGHPPTPDSMSGTGYAVVRGRSACYPCSDDATRQLMLTETRMGAYLTGVPGVGEKVTCWTGGELGAVTRVSRSGRLWGRDGWYQRVYLRVTDVHGQEWVGVATTQHDLVSLRRAKGGRR